MSEWDDEDMYYPDDDDSGYSSDDPYDFSDMPDDEGAYDDLSWLDMYDDDGDYYNEWEIGGTYEE